MFMISKTNRLLALMLIAALFASVGCNSTADKNFEEAIIGSWLTEGATFYFGSSVAAADSSLDYPDTMGQDVETFNADGTSTRVSRLATNRSNFTIVGDVITMISTNNSKTDTTMAIVNITGNSMTITAHFEQAISPWGIEAWVVAKYTRQ